MIIIIAVLYRVFILVFEKHTTTSPPSQHSYPETRSEEIEKIAPLKNEINENKPPRLSLMFQQPGTVKNVSAKLSIVVENILWVKIKDISGRLKHESIKIWGISKPGVALLLLFDENQLCKNIFFS